MAGFCNSIENSLLAHFFGGAAFAQPSAWYIALHTQDPTDAGNVGEVTGGSYARQNCTSWAAPSNGLVDNAAEVNFAGMPATTVTHFTIWSAVSGGTPYINGALLQSKTTLAGETLRLPIGDLDITLD